MTCCLAIRKHSWCRSKPQILYARILNNSPNMSSLHSPSSGQATGTHYRKTNSFTFLPPERPSTHWHKVKTVTKHLYIVSCWWQLSGLSRLLLVRTAPGCNQLPVRNHFFQDSCSVTWIFLIFLMLWAPHRAFTEQKTSKNRQYSWISDLLFQW